jgi:hypothetical protein
MWLVKIPASKRRLKEEIMTDERLTFVVQQEESGNLHEDVENTTEDIERPLRSYIDVSLRGLVAYSNNKRYIPKESIEKRAPRLSMLRNTQSANNLSDEASQIW